MSNYYQNPWNNPDFAAGWNNALGSDLTNAPRYKSAFEWVEENIGGFSNKSLIDIGCGNGNLIRHFAHANFQRWHGIDSGSEIIKTAMTNVVDPRVTFTHLNPAESFPIATTGKDYDVATALFVIGYVSHENFPQFCLTMAELLKEGGKAVIYSNHPMNGLNKNPHKITHPLPGESLFSQGYFDMRPSEHMMSVFHQDRKVEVKSTHHHRTVATIVNTFADAGLYLKNMLELPPDTDLGDIKHRKPQWNDVPQYIGLTFEKRMP